jgi:hypothetical protein
MIPFCECDSSFKLARLNGRGMAASAEGLHSLPNQSSNPYGASCTALRGQLQCYRLLSPLMFHFLNIVFLLDWFTDFLYFLPTDSTY